MTMMEFGFGHPDIRTSGGSYLVILMAMSNDVDTLNGVQDLEDKLVVVQNVAACTLLSSRCFGQG